MPRFLSATLLLLAGLSRAASSTDVYSIPLRDDGRTNLHWTIDYVRERIQFEVHAAVAGNASWFAIGFSDYGRHEWADFCVFWIDWMKGTHFQDAWTNGNGRIGVDRSQDCEDFRHKWDGDVLKFTYSRKFDTCDPQDYVIEDGTTHVVWAEGEGPLYKLDGVTVTSSESRGFERTELLKAENAREEHPADTWTMEVLADKVRVPGTETTYWCHVRELPEALTRKHHVVQYEPVIQKGNEHLVHHMEVFHCEANAGEDIPNYVGSCFDERRPERTRVCKRVVAAWAMGAGPFSYPKEAGLPIGGPEYNRYVMLEVHYNNPELKTGWVDSSGIRFYVTPSLRPHDGGVMEIGLEYTDKMAIPPGQAEFRLSGYCIAECTAVSLRESGIIAFGSQLHTHLLGVKVRTRHVRNGVELPLLNGDNHYSTHFQEIRRLKRGVRVLPGDALITTCTYRTTDRENVTLGGFSITDEMCVNYVHYYPKTDLEVCKSSVSYDSLHGYFDFLRRYENQATDSRSKGISDNYKAIEWTPLRAQVLSDLYDGGTLSMQCNRSSGERFPGDWEGMRVTRVAKPLRPEPRCRGGAGGLP